MKITLNELRNLIKSVIREETSKKTKKNSDTESYEEGVDKYKYFVYNVKDKKVESGFEYQGDAKDAASDYYNAKVVTAAQLEKMGISVDALKNKWKKM